MQQQLTQLQQALAMKVDLQHPAELSSSLPCAQEELIESRVAEVRAVRSESEQRAMAGATESAAVVCAAIADM